MIRKLVLALVVSIAISSAATAYAQSSGTQTNTLTVPPSVSIVAPSAATLTHDQSDNPQAFPSQNWLVTGNSITGVTVTFAVPTAFVHSVDSSYKRDAKLNLSVGSHSGPATWTVGTAEDTTDYANSDNSAQVSASSDGAGQANLALTVTFVGGQWGLFASGTYTTTVTGTVTANP